MRAQREALRHSMPNLPPLNLNREARTACHSVLGVQGRAGALEHSGWETVSRVSFYIGFEVYRRYALQ